MEASELVCQVYDVNRTDAMGVFLAYLHRVGFIPAISRLNAALQGTEGVACFQVRQVPGSALRP